MNNKSLVTTEPASPSTLPAEYGGSLAVSLARAEVDQQISTARAYPRSITRAVASILTLATLNEKAAAECIYGLPRGRDDSGATKIVKGPSIRLAEIVASQWGNCRVGARVVHVDRFEKYVEAEGVFHDLETNMATTSRVRRGIVDSKGRLYRDDMIIMTGNAACAIAKRNAILGGVPRGVWYQGYEAVEHVILGDVKTLVSRRRSALATFAAEYKITADRIFAALEVDGEADIDLEKLADLTKMRSGLKNGETTLEELFPIPSEQPSTDLNDRLETIAAKGSNGNHGSRAAPGGPDYKPDPRDPPHDPETGEIIGGHPADAVRHHQEQHIVETLSSAEKDARAKAPPGEPATPPANENGPAPNMENDPHGDEAGRRLKGRLDQRAERAAASEATKKRVESEAELADRGLKRLLDDARDKTKDGALKFKYWMARLPKEHFNQLVPYAEKLTVEANAVDAAREANL